MKAKYYIYRNLRTGGFSIKFRGKVIDRDDWFEATNVTFKVNEVSRQRVIFEKQKNVHAFVVADRYLFTDTKVDNQKIISYNPYKLAHFVCDGQKIENAKRVLFRHGKCYLLDK